MKASRGMFARMTSAAAVVAAVALSSVAHAQTEPAADPSALAAAPATAAPATTPAATATTGTAPSTTPSPAPAETTEPAAERKRTAWPWIVMGTGVALIVTAAVFQVKAVSEDDKREAADTKLSGLPAGDPGRPGLIASVEDHEKSAENSRTASLIIGTAGFLTVAGAVVWWFAEGGGSPDPKANGALASSSPRANSADKPIRPSFLPTFGPSYAGASFGASF